MAKKKHKKEKIPHEEVTEKGRTKYAEEPKLIGKSKYEEEESE